MAEALRCALCHHRCRIPPGGRGLCGTRENRAAPRGSSAGGRENRGDRVDRISAEGLFLPYYGYITALAVDPIEKKPLYHFRPGSRVLSLGFAGCNLRCPFCQNWQISQLGDSSPGGRNMRPEDVVALALEDASGPAGVGPQFGSAGPARPGPRIGNTGSASPAGLSTSPFPVAGAFPRGQIAYTYSEPLIHFEFVKECMERAHERGIANLLVSNGCINPEMAEKILPLVDAANIDLKCFSEKTYRETLGGDLETVLNFIRAARHYGVCLELCTLVVPGLNDDEAELDRCAEFIAALGDEPFGEGTASGDETFPAKAAAGFGGERPRPKAAAASGGPAAFGKRPVPWHLSACHPSYRWTGAPTRAAALWRLAERARRILPFVYTGNIPGEENDTPCPRCGALLVRRRGYRVDTGLLAVPAGVPPSEAGADPAENVAKNGLDPTYGRPRPCRCASCGAEVPVYW